MVGHPEHSNASARFRELVALFGFLSRGLLLLGSTALRFKEGSSLRRSCPRAVNRAVAWPVAGRSYHRTLVIWVRQRDPVKGDAFGKFRCRRRLLIGTLRLPPFDLVPRRGCSGRRGQIW